MIQQDGKRRQQPYLLRLPVSIHDQAVQIAHTECTSLNHFIAIALAEKISRMSQEAAQRNSASIPRSALHFGLPALKFPRTA